MFMTLMYFNNTSPTHRCITSNCYVHESFKSSHWRCKVIQLFNKSPTRLLIFHMDDVGERKKKTTKLIRGVCLQWLNFKVLTEDSIRVPGRNYSGCSQAHNTLQCFLWILNSQEIPLRLWNHQNCHCLNPHFPSYESANHEQDSELSTWGFRVDLGIQSLVTSFSYRLLYIQYHVLYCIC